MSSIKSVPKPEMPTCEVCGKNKAVGVASVPGVAYSAAYCRECLEADAHPYFIVVANTALCGGLDQTCAEWRAMVASTLKHLNKTQEQFDADVQKSLADIEEHVEPERPKKALNVDDKVRWTSQSQGSSKTKIGYITEIVPPGAQPKSTLVNPGGPRDHESYVVSVCRSPKAKQKLYWPRAASLKRVLRAK